jgi:hypothetical protein
VLIQETTLVSVVLLIMLRCLCIGFLGVWDSLLMMVRITYLPIPPGSEGLKQKQNSSSLLVIIDGLLRGFQDGQDIFTLSLGGADGWTESSSAVVASRLVDQGKVVTISAGNDVSFN